MKTDPLKMLFGLACLGAGALYLILRKEKSASASPSLQVRSADAAPHPFELLDLKGYGLQPKETLAVLEARLKGIKNETYRLVVQVTSQKDGVYKGTVLSSQSKTAAPRPGDTLTFANANILPL